MVGEQELRKHIVFGIIALSFVFLSMTYAMNTQIGIEQGFAQTLGQVTWYLVLLAGGYYGIVYLIEKFKPKPKSKTPLS